MRTFLRVISGVIALGFIFLIFIFVKDHEMRSGRTLSFMGLMAVAFGIYAVKGKTANYMIGNSNLDKTLPTTQIWWSLILVILLIGFIGYWMIFKATH